MLTNPGVDAQGRASYRLALASGQLVTKTFQSQTGTERRLPVPAQLPV